MPLTSTSLGHWMKQHSPGELTVTTGRAPIRSHHNPPHGCSARFQLTYALRYGWRSLLTLPDGNTETQLGVGLVTDGSAMFVINPCWAHRLPYLGKNESAGSRLIELPPGNSADPMFYSSRAAPMSKLYTEDNEDMDSWYHKGCCAPSTIWARYDVTIELVDSNGILWRKLHSLWVAKHKEDGSLPHSFPKERKATAGSFPTEVWIREDWLRVLGQSMHELNNVYQFYVFKPNSRHIVVVDRRCNVIVAEFAGGVPRV